MDLNNFLDITVEEIFADRFSRYSKYIIQDRALPDVRDGLKPVQRRILFSMYKEGNTFEKPFRKSAKTVGNVIGNYHPHGDTSVYDAMVRMSQTWKVNQPIIIMHGNNGSIDGDSAAAMRYTETKLSEYSNLVIKNLNEATVDMAPNFDDTELEPTVLPTRVCNLLTNGATGISMGYATDIPPHNPNEVIDACIAYNKNNKITLDEIIEIMPGPDFPTGAIVQGKSGIREAYETGRGRVMLQGEYEIKGDLIKITSIPYEVNKANLLQKMDQIRIDKKVDGINEILDLSDMSGIEIHINLKKSANKELVINYLLKNTDLQKSYNYNMIAINNRRPEQMSVLGIIKSFIEFREEVITRRSEYRLAKAKAKMHIIDGMIKAVDIMDEIIATIRSSKNKGDAKLNIAKQFGFSLEQAEAIVMMQLYRLSNTDITQLREQHAQLSADITILDKILSSKATLKKLITQELKDSKDLINHPRRTTIEDEIRDIKIDSISLIKEEKLIISVSKNGYIKASPTRSYLTSNLISGTTAGFTAFKTVLSNTRDKVLVFFNDGTFVIIPANEIETSKWRDNGKHISTIAKINDGVEVVNIVSTQDFKNFTEFVTLTNLGYITKMNFADLNLSRTKQKMVWQNLKKDDKVVDISFFNSSMLSSEDTLNVGFVSSLDRYMVIDITKMELGSLKRMGKKVATLRKDETYKFIFNAGSGSLLFTDKCTYLQFKDLEATTKPQLLFTNVKSSPQSIVTVMDLTDEDLLFVSDSGETVVKTDIFKVSNVEEKPKKSPHVYEAIEKIRNIF